MKRIKTIAVMLLITCLLSVFSFGESFPDRNDDGKIGIGDLNGEIADLLKDNKLNKDFYSFTYYDLKRDVRYDYNGDGFFEAPGIFKFPFAFYLYEKAEKGEYDRSKFINEKNYADAFNASLLEDNMNETEAFIQELGGAEKVKAEMKKYSGCSYDESYYSSYSLSGNYCVDFLEKFYDKGFGNDQVFISMMIEPLKNYSEGEYLEKGVATGKITHKFEADKTFAYDIGIVNSENPYAIAVFVKDRENAKEILEKSSEIACRFNQDFAKALTSHKQVRADVPKEQKKPYDYEDVNQPAMYAVIGIGAAAVIALTIYFISKKHIRKDF